MFFSSRFGKRRKARRPVNSAKCRGPVRVQLTLEQLEDRLALAAGALDTTFSDDGRLAIDIGPNPGAITSYDTVLQPDGRLVSVGSGPGGDFFLMRLNANGSIDPTFSNGSLDSYWDGGDGMHLIDPNGAGGNTLVGVALQLDGKVVAVGGRFVVRLTPSGQRDTTFGTNGLLALPAVGTGTGGSFNGTGLVVQPDGKIVVSGYANFTGTGNDFAAIRLNADGTLDTTFDGDGIRSIAFSATTGSDRAQAVALDASGRIVLGGFATGAAQTDFAAVRLNADGSLDTSFDADGMVAVGVFAGLAADSAIAALIQPDGKIVLAGVANPAGSFQINSFTAIRLNSDGSLDTTFDGDGIRVVPGSGDSAAPGADEVALLPDGRIVMVGAAPGAVQGGQAYYDFTVVVLTTAGANDTTFSGDGILIFEPNPAIGNGNNLRATGVVVTSSGQLLVSGNSGGPASFARINTDGAFDTTYGTNGIVNQQYRLLGSDTGNSAALQSDGKIVVAGSSSFTFATNTDFALARVNADGTLDTTFGNNGVLTTNLAGQDTAYAVAVQPDGKIVAAGGTNQASPSLDTTAGVVRYNADGSLDPSFGVNGILNLNLGTTNDVFNAITIQPDGKIVLGGSIRTASGTNYDFAVVRLNADGSYDTSFGVVGLVRLAIGVTDQVFSLAIQPDGKILASGSSDIRGAVVRLNADGALDASFDLDGIAIFGGTGLNQLRGFEGMALQADGKLVFTGNTLTTQPGGTAAHIGVARLNADGSVDTSFSGDGVAPVVFVGGSSADSVAVTHDGRILVGGRVGGTNDFAVARLLSDGTLDPSFDTDGRVTVDMAGAPYGYVDTTTFDDLTALLVQPDGNIVLAGSIGTSPAPSSGGSDFGLARLEGGGVPPIDIQLSNGMIPENAGANALVGTLTTIDPNTLDTHTYTFVSGAGDADNAHFAIAGNQLRAVASFDFETRSTYTIRLRSTDQTGYFVEEAFTVTITSVNEAPTANNDAYSTTEDTPLNVALPGVLANDTDIEGDALSAVLVSGPTNGTFSFAANGSFVYTPNPNYFGPDSFTYKANDSQLDSNVAVVNITVNPANDAPTANNDAYSTTEDTPLTVALPGVLANDTDIEGDALSAVLVSGPTNGTFSFAANGSFVYTPNPNYFGPDSFTYKANDSQLDSNVAVVNITVSPLNDAPTANNDAYSTTEDTPLTVALPGVLANDIDIEGDALSAVLVSGPTNGTFSFAANGSFVYTPNPNYFGPDSFTYKANDSQLDSNVAVVNITVTPVNDAPIAGNDTATVTEDSVGNSITVLSNDSTGPANESGQSLIVTTASALHGSVTINANGTLNYSPNTDYNGLDTITYSIQDNGTTNGVVDPRTDDGVVTIIVTAVDEPAAIRGTKFTDLTGNGLTSDDTPLAGVTIKLYRDANGNGVLNVGTDTYVASTITAADGSYAFPTFGNGTYFVNEPVSSGYVRTYPLLSDTHTVQVSADTYATGRDFANFQKCDKNAVSGYYYVINGTETVSDLTGNVDEGDVVKVVFTIASNRSNFSLSLVSYKTPEDVFHAETAYLQQIFDLDDGVFTGSGSLTVTVPSSFYQIDFVCGAAIDRFGPANSNIFYSAQSRLFDADNGGSPSSFAGYVYRDDNNNGVKSSSEPGISGVKITLTGTNDLNQAITKTTTTSSSGAYIFGNLRPGTYKLVETQPTTYNDGQDSLGTAGGIKGNDVFSSIVLGAKVKGTNYNFGERKKNQNLNVSASFNPTDGSDPSEPSNSSAARAELLSTSLVVSVVDPEGRLDYGERARVMDAVGVLNDALASRGITVLVTTDAEIPADVSLTIDDSSPCGAADDGVLGCATEDGGITLLDGWHWYIGGDAGAIGSGQYDFQTIVTHELGHAIGLGHSHDASSVMYESLSTGITRRLFTALDLSTTEVHEEENGAEPLLALQPGRWQENSHSMGNENSDPSLVIAHYAAAPNIDQRVLLESSDRELTAGGSDDNILSGGSGDELMVGGDGHDVLIGGFAGDSTTNPKATGIELHTPGDTATLDSAIAELWRDEFRP